MFKPTGATMSYNNLALGFYQDLAVAQQVLHKLSRKGFKRAAAIQRLDDNKVVIHQQPGHRPLLYANAILALLVLIASLALPSLQTLFITALLIVAGISMVAWLIGYFSNQIDPALIQRFQTQVLPNEVLILTQVRTQDARHALAILRQVPNGHPVSFLLRSDIPQLDVYQELISEPLNQEQMQLKATQLAEKLEKAPLIISRNSALLQQLRHSANILNTIRYNVAEAQHVEQTISLAAEWLLDNNYVIQGNLIEVQRSLPKKYYCELPKVNSPNIGTVPRAYLVGKEILNGTASKLSHENIAAFIKSYQTVQPLTIGELWALPLFLRMLLIENIQSLALHIDRRLCEGEQAGFWGYRLIQAARRHPQQLSSFLAEMAKENPHPSPHFAEELLDHLADEETVQPLIRSWLEERLLVPVPEVIYREQLRKTTEQVALSNAIVSLITLSQLSWREIFEELSIVDAILKDDPAGIYPHMNFTTHDTYRHAIETIARHSAFSEIEVAKQLLKLANSGKNTIERHVGYYLIDQGRPVLEKAAQCQPTYMQKIRRWILLHPAQIYIGSICCLTFLMLSALFAISTFYGATAAQALLFMILALLPVSEIAVQIVNLILVRILPPFVMPKMSFKEGIPPEYKTIVVIPMMLLTRESIQESIHHLEVHYLANNDPQLVFALFSDFADAPQHTMPEDEELLDIAVSGIQTLTNKYGTDQFFLFNRLRTWNSSENAWIGEERKRGKLECLNHLLCNLHQDSLIIQVGSPTVLRNIRYVITLDTDTQLPKDSARQLIETITHPLNAPQISAEGQVTRGYTIIQPRVSTDFPKAQVSLFTRLFADVIGLDPYTQVISDIYQDLTREGTYHGKGIYDLHAFNRVLNQKFPPNHILSHDLIEGAYARVGFASDIALFDCYPPTYMTWSKRQHRWMRGDWQIANWLLSYVPTANQHRIRNTLSAINRWKIFDNLRRALLPITTLALLVSAWLLSSQPALWTALATLVLFMPAIAFIFCQYLPHPSLLLKMAKQPLKALIKAVVYIAILPHQAWLSLDALARVIYRRFYYNQYLIEWSTGNNASQ
jgi:cyclic beta-1,2-glucan synthetase